MCTHETQWYTDNNDVHKGQWYIDIRGIYETVVQKDCAQITVAEWYTTNMERTKRWYRDNNSRDRRCIQNDNTQTTMVHRLTAMVHEL